MLLLRSNSESEPEVWRARTSIRGDAEDVLRALTDPELIAGWAPVSFELADPRRSALRAGSRESVSGSIAGLRVSFDVHVTRADRARLELVADGPVALDVAYRFREHGGEVLVDAQVGVRRGGGLGGQLLCAAIGALLSAGALERALTRLRRCVCERGAPQLVAA